MSKLERDADAGETGEGVAWELGRDDDARRELAGQLVMVGDDDVHAQLLGQQHLLDCIDAAVDGDEQAHTVGRKLLDGGTQDVVPLGEAVGQPPAHIGAQTLQDFHGHERGRYAIGVVVPVHRDGLSLLKSAVDPCSRRGHAAQQVRAVQTVVGVQETTRGGHIGEPAPGQDLGRDLAHIQLRRQTAHDAEVDMRDAPGVAVHELPQSNARPRRKSERAEKPS